MRFSPKVVKMTWLGIGETASLEFRTEKKIFEKNIGGGAPEAPPLGSTGLTDIRRQPENKMAAFKPEVHCIFGLA